MKTREIRDQILYLDEHTGRVTEAAPTRGAVAGSLHRLASWLAWKCKIGWAEVSRENGYHSYWYCYRHKKTGEMRWQMQAS